MREAVRAHSVDDFEYNIDRIGNALYGRIIRIIQVAYESKMTQYRNYIQAR